MPRYAFGLLMVVVCGCSSARAVSGVWQGACTLVAPGVVEPEVYDLDYRILGNRDGSLSGTAAVVAPFLVKPIGGTLEGTHVDDYITVAAMLGDQTLGFTLTLAGALQDEAIEGDCATETASGTGRITRTGDLPEDTP